MPAGNGASPLSIAAVHHRDGEPDAPGPV
jgi:hypothetical protein